jgi:surface antigen
MERTYRDSLENSQSGKTSTWYNPDTKNKGSFTPQEAYQNKRDEYCREFQQTVTIGGKVQTAYGTACRQPDGNWKIVSK